MKIQLQDLKKAIQALESANNLSITVYNDGHVMTLVGQSRIGDEIRIELYVDGTLLPKLITKQQL